MIGREEGRKENENYRRPLFWIKVFPWVSTE
jgi:hypothetical protein